MRGPMLSRRTLLGAWASGALLAALPGGRGLAASGRKAYRLQARKATVPLVGPGYPATGIWGYDGRAPGPELRVRQGEPLQVRVENTLDQPTSVHWHGIRLPNAMDGVAGLTQAPIRPGEGFTYAFTPPDAGTYWYHSHIDGTEQIGRGLAGALIVEEVQPVPVDRDLTWVVNDWRLDREAQIVDDFGNLHDLSHAGRIGNVVTVNGRLIDEFPVRAGERIRLRLINAATARHLALEFRGHRPWILALDGQPVAPWVPDDATVVLAPGARADLLLILGGQPGERFEVVDAFYPRQAYRLLTLAYGAEPLRPSPSPEPFELPANPLPEPDLANALRQEVIFEGGAMGGLRSARVDGRSLDLRSMARQHGLVWAVNGVAETASSLHTPMLTLRRGQSVVLELINRTAWPHPIHLHGHHFRVLRRNGQRLSRPEWRDTELLPRDGSAEVAFVADNPGDWLLHCHVVSHMAGGMVRMLRVVA